ncbi:MAG TPA: hypothetical protein VG816_15560 [Solirubrobacterales bacterium]|nr:hypothetical protein [Solirubrobacterales bacterium]
MRTTRGAIAVLAATAGLATVAYAASPHGSQPGSAPTKERGRGSVSLPKPKIFMHPEKVSPSTRARFGFAAKGRKLRFQCRLDARPWSACQSPLSITRLAIGTHKFSVRTTAKGGAHSKTAGFGWRVLEPKDFSISPQLSNLGALYPGAAAQQLPVTISNPNPVPILVTSLDVRATADPPGCASGENLLLGGAGVSGSNPLTVPPNGSASLPAPGISAPTIFLRDLPVSQDACQRAQFPLAFSGKARG